MTVVLDAITRKKLVLVKQLYQQGLLQSAASHVMVQRIMAIISLDLANETFLKAVIGSLDSSKSPSESFPGLVQQAEGMLAGAIPQLGSLPDRVNLLHVHALRNDAQHKAKYPNESDVNDCRTYTRDFLEKLVFQVWGLAFDGITLADLIQHQDVKEFLLNAEVALSQGNYQEAVQEAAAGMTWALQLVKATMLGHPFGMINHSRIQEFRDIDSRLKQMENVMLRLVMGLGYIEHHRYQDIVGNVFFHYDTSKKLGAAPDYSSVKPQTDPHNAEFVVAYCIDTILHMESRVGTLDDSSPHYSWLTTP